MLAIDENNVLRYVDEYVDIMENISNQVQPLISEIRRLDIIYFDIINQLDMCKKMLASATTPSARSNIFDQVQHLLHFGQINGDRKIECLRELLASFEAKNTRLDQHVSILEPPPLPNPQTRLTQASSSARRPSIGGTKHSMTDKSSHNNHLESQPINRDGRTPTTSNDTTRLNGRLKRPRKPKPVDLDESPHQQQHLDTSTISTLKSIGESSGSNNDANNGSEKSNGEKKRRASVRACKPTNKKRAGGRNVHVPVDPDEPTYCHCGQVSFGDMIGCDYGKCAIEWFHFECVELKSKPKGKWYCPECRGDKMNVLKASLAK